MNGLIIDNFAGGGGASTGIEMAIGRSVDVAINHDPAAIAMHRANHPDTKHYLEDVWDVDPMEVCNGEQPALCWFSPDCTHFSRAKGGKPVDHNIRGLAWVAVRWAIAVRPAVIMLENVPEIQTWGPLDKHNQPIKERAGETFDGFIKALTTGMGIHHPAIHEAIETLGIEAAGEIICGLGYTVEYRTLTSCDYGAPTKRTRFYLIARSDGKPIIWPKPTHGDPDGIEVRSGMLKPWRTAAECIDWSIPAQSIFERKKPLAENTLRRIARGIKKYVIDNPEPFIVQIGYGERSGQKPRVNGVYEPLGTVVSTPKHYLVTPTIMCNNDHNNGTSVTDPLNTVTTGNRHYLVAPSLIQYHTETGADEVRGQPLNEPLMTQDTSNRYALSVAHIMKNYAGGYTGSGSAADKPLGTVTAKDHNSLVTAHIMTMRNHQDGQPIDEPLSTITAGGAHHAEVQAFLVKYFSTGAAKSVTEPLDTITTKDRFGLVTIHGEEYVITDIRMRMLQPKELFAAQGFPPDYIIDHDADGNPYPKCEQTAKCGNAVTPPVACALVLANLPELCERSKNK